MSNFVATPERLVTDRTRCYHRTLQPGPPVGEDAAMKLVVTIPALNEEKTIAQVISGVPLAIPGIDEVEVIVMNDGSEDRTAEIAERAGATVINISGRPGLGYIFRTGLERAMRRGADIIVNIDGDGQFNSGDIAKLVEPLLRDEADFVTCSRFADPALRPVMPTVKFYGNQAVTRMINWVCGGTDFTDVSCGFRAFNREAAYRLTLFGRFTYTQECFIDLFSKGLRIAEVPLKVRGVREHGKSRIASNLWKYATNSLPIILRAMRDIQPMKFFGGIAAIVGVPGVLMAAFVTVWYLAQGRTTPFTSLIAVSGAMVIVGFLMFAVALLADMMGRHRRITEELLYLARRKIYSSRRTIRASLPPTPEEPHVAIPTMHDTWSLPVMKVIHASDSKDDSGAPVGAPDNAREAI
ncbi:MAG TPA: glycosyltransferase family 2 protein [Tepidisphaeraceae bacterium]|nr:glycosyltransferase family 2 protein [Tepidisphaeraceae bacterium]